MQAEQNYVATSEYAGYYTGLHGERTYTVLLGRDRHHISCFDRQEFKNFKAERLAWDTTVVKMGKIVLGGAYGISLFFAPVQTLVAGAVFSPLTIKLLEDSVDNESIAKEMSVYLMQHPQDKKVQAFLYAKYQVKVWRRGG